MLSVFYIPFATLVVPGVMITRKVGPHWSLPAMMMGWGAMATINAAAGSFAGCLVIRLCKYYAWETSVKLLTSQCSEPLKRALLPPSYST
jgi:hypothetical protein